MPIAKDRQTRVEAMGQDQQDMATDTAPTDNEDARSVLARKTQAGRVTHQARAMSVPKALRLTLAKVADELLDMAMAVIGVRIEKCESNRLAQVFKEPALLMLLDGPARRCAAAAFDPLLVGGLIQQQTMGTVLPDVGGEPRNLTETDAAICAPFLDALLERAATLPETEEERHLLEGFRFGTRPEDSRLLLMALEEPEYQIIHLTVDMAGGKRQGYITLCLPLSAKMTEPTMPEHDRPGRAGDAEGRNMRSLNETVLGLHIDLNLDIH